MKKLPDIQDASSTFAAVAAGIYSTIPQEELKEILSILEKVEIDTTIADVISSDPETSSRRIPYYRNNKHRIYSVFEDYPDDLEIIQSLNMYLISQIPKCSLVRIPYPKPGLKTDLKFSKLGRTTEINKLVSELIFLLRIREDIDYDNSIYRGYSKLSSWLFKTVGFYRKMNDKVVHVVLSSRDHEFLTENLKTESDTLSYRAIQQTISLLCVIASLPSTLTKITNRVHKLLGNEIPNLVLRKNLSDISNIEPYYIWLSVTTPEERGVLTKKVGENFFQTQNKLLRNIRGVSSPTASKDLVDLKKKVDSNLPNGTKATIYGRLKFYNHLKSQDDVKKLLISRKGTKQLSIAELHRYARDQGVLSLFAPENIIGTCHNVINKPTELMDLTKSIKYNRDTDNLFYYKQDIESCLTIKTLQTRVEEKTATNAELSLLSSINTRMITFIPGVDRRL
jgi:hypothetical protein